MTRACALLPLVVLLACKPETPPRTHGTTLGDYARKAQERRVHEALVPYATDEEEGESLIIRDFDEALTSYEWIIGEPIEEKTITSSKDATSIFTVYRMRIEHRL